MKADRETAWKTRFGLREILPILLLLMGAAFYLGCGAPSEPPPAATGVQPAPSATTQPPSLPPEPAGEIKTRGGPGKTAKPSPFRAFDRILEQMPVGNIAFNTPTVVNLNDTASIQLILSLSKSVEELKQMIQAEGEKQGESIKVSDHMEARLTGPHFQIHAITPESQGIASQEDTKWAWEVKPLKAGRQVLHLTLTAKFAVNGQPVSRVIRTFDRAIEVNVTLVQTATDFLEKFGNWLWAGVILPLAGWLWKRRKAAQQRAAQEDKDPS